MFDEVDIRFEGGGRTTIYVSEDDDIRTEIAALCETEGWDLDSVVAYAIRGQVEEG